MASHITSFWPVFCHFSVFLPPGGIAKSGHFSLGETAFFFDIPPGVSLDISFQFYAPIASAIPRFAGRIHALEIMGFADSEMFHDQMLRYFQKTLLWERDPVLRDAVGAVAVV
jgi:hypothetical protein